MMSFATAAMRPPTSVRLLARIATLAILSSTGCGTPQRAVPVDQSNERPVNVDPPARPAPKPRRAAPSVARADPPASVEPQPARVPENACAQVAGGVLRRNVRVTADAARVYIYPRQMQQPLSALPQGTTLPVTQREGDWLFIRFQDRRWGPRVGYVHCADVVVPPAAVADAQPAPPVMAEPHSGASAITRADTRESSPSRSESAPSGDALPLEKRKMETVAGYVEWFRDDYLITDGQRVRWNEQTRLKLGRVPTVRQIPLGYEIKVKGIRLADGALLALELEAKPNGVAAYEREVRQGSDDLETTWIQRGAVFRMASDGRYTDGGRVRESGPDVDRVRRLVARLAPPYVDASRLRVRLIETNEWNASAMGNGAIWVNKGLLDDVASDDELAFVLGHELAHYTHEHPRRGVRNGALIQLAAQAAQLALGHVDSATKHAALSIGTDLALSAWGSGYTRSLEDQADLVGLRYAYEAGFDVRQAPKMWRRVLERSGQPDRVSNFFLGDHSRASDRIRNLERELQINYRAGTAH